ncbi:sigma 54-interacting transcriptional regulator [Cytobacillus spongiae]|uniref:sigma-54 interaction domain-containing protein n=1 Tax=Cytobacillus spongiae TaxID=2901381 RepID=UPI001F3A6D0E|nr:sigma 54-interacting transcriptional regulator [Cytobacillus spongiae]UII57076.1 sigma 54-interacting transcriptional regulator [Cytobacillus spongiae]
MEQITIHHYLQNDFSIIDNKYVKSTDEGSSILIMKKGNKYFYAVREEILYFKEPYFREATIVDENALIESLFGQSVSAYIIVLNEKHNVVGYLRSSRVHQELYRVYKRQSAFFQTMVDTMDHSVSVVDHNEKTLVWTKGAERLFSISQEEIIGESMSRFFPKERLLNCAAMMTKQSYRQHLHQPREDLYVLINASPVIVDGEVIGAIAEETDVTSQMYMNQELLKVSSKIHRLEKEVSQWKEGFDAFQKIKGSSPKIKETRAFAKKMATTNANLLLLGETGVGKEVFARAIHEERSSKEPFIAINCGALSSTLFEAELFGYAPGAFTGGDPKGKAGKISIAGNGTLFLDEIGDLPLEQQVKLLRILENRTYFPVGGNKQFEVKCRIIAATNQPLEKKMSDGTFREDLYYRLNTFSLEIPPLRNRKQDLIEYLHQFIYEFSVVYDKQIERVTPLVMKALYSYDWPGNIRELRSCVERAVLLADNGQLDVNGFPGVISSSVMESSNSSDFLSSNLEQYEVVKIIEALKMEKGNKKKAAERLGVSRATLYNKLKKFGLNSVN